MIRLRKNDNPDNAPPSRTERVFTTGGLWYFHTRERRNVGPFRYESEARQMLARLIAEAVTAATVASTANSKPHFRLSAIAKNIDQARLPV